MNEIIKEKNNIKLQPVTKLGQLTITFLGGVSEVGKSCCLYEYDDEAILVDCGIKLNKYLTDGCSASLPDLNFLKKKQHKIKAIVLTHAHADHIGGLGHLCNFVLKQPVKMISGRFGIELIKEYFKGNKIKNKLFLHNDQFIPIENRKKISLGKYFQLNFAEITHTIPDSFFVFISTPLKNILHTGDFRFDFLPLSGGNDFEFITSKAGLKKIDVLVADSTRITEPGISESESIIKSSMQNLFDTYSTKRIIIAIFASNVTRILYIVELAKKMGREVFFSGVSMSKCMIAALKAGIIKNQNLCLNLEKHHNLPPEKVLIILTGAQGEENASLFQYSIEKHNFIKPLPSKDVIVFSANVIPGNEQQVFHLVSNLLELGVIVKHPMLDQDKSNKFHVSGHGNSKDSYALFNMIKPTYFIPVHGDRCNMFAHKKIALDSGLEEENIFILSNGNSITFTNDKVVKNINVYNPILLDENNEITSYESIEIKQRMYYYGCINFIIKNSVLNVNCVRTSRKIEQNIHLIIQTSKTIDFKNLNRATITNKLELMLCKMFNLTLKKIPHVNVITLFLNKVDSTIQKKDHKIN